MEEETASVSAVAEELAQVLAAYDGDSAPAQHKLREMSESVPAAFRRVAIARLGLGRTGSAENYLALLLANDRGYPDVLTDPDQLADKPALTAAATMARVDSEFFRKLMEMRGSPDQRRVLRVLLFIERDEQAMTLVPWLRDLVDGGNSSLASKAAMILCRLTRNPMVLEKLLRSPDARVRANAVEGLWGVGTSSRTRELLRAAARDSHHRVAANALVELYRRGDSIARAKIEELARHPDALFRAAIAWAIGEIGSPDLLSTLRLLEHDSVLAVRLRAGRTAKLLQRPRTESAAGANA